MFAAGDTKMEGVASHQMLRLLAFSTCLVRLLGTAFTTLRLAQYKEFIKHIGQTIRCGWGGVVAVLVQG